MYTYLTLSLVLLLLFLDQPVLGLGSEKTIDEKIKKLCFSFLYSPKQLVSPSIYLHSCQVWTKKPEYTGLVEPTHTHTFTHTTFFLHNSLLIPRPYETPAPLLFFSRLSFHATSDAPNNHASQGHNLLAPSKPAPPFSTRTTSHRSSSRPSSTPLPVSPASPCT